MVAASHFEGLLTTLCGYCVLGVILVVLHALAALLGFQRSQRILGLGYVIVKVRTDSELFNPEFTVIKVCIN